MPASLEQEKRDNQNKDQSNTPDCEGGGEEQETEGQDAGEQEEEKKPVDPAKRRMITFLALAVLLLVAAGCFAWWSHSQTYENTDDAQVDGHLNPIASRVAGTIRAVYVENNQRVEAGQPLLDLDTSDLEVTLAQSQAQYDQALAQLQGEQPNVSITVTSNQTEAATSHHEVTNADAALAVAEHDYQASLAQLQQAEANNGRAQSDFLRYTLLLEKHEVAQSEYDQYDAAAKAQAAAVNAQRASVASAAKTIEQRGSQLRQQQARRVETLLNAPRQVMIRQASVKGRKASLGAAAAQLRQDRLNLSYCHILAPVSGIVSQRTSELGGRISVGQQLMMIVQTTNLWVTANFKETQLRKMKTGQRTTIEVDALDQTFDGYVQDMAASTGDRTSALPPENATGNYVKIVQRMPVRIRFKQNQEGLSKLRPGMSVVPKVHFE